MPLTDTLIRSAKPTEKAQRMFDGSGLYLEISPSGGKWWRLKYRFAGKEKRLSLGVYPEVSLKAARIGRDDNRKLLAQGIDPGENRKAQKLSRIASAADSFEVVAREWLSKMKPNWSESHYVRVKAKFENDVFPRVGRRPISEITAQELLTVLQKVENRGAVDTAHRIRWSCGQVFRFGIATGRCTRNIVPDLKGALAPAVGGNFPAATTPDQIAGILRAIDGYKGTLVVLCAIKLAPLVFVRPGELRKALWTDINLEAAEWTFILSKKQGAEKPRLHTVPLSQQAVSILKDVQLLTGHGKYVFPSARSTDRPMSDNAVNAALRRMGIAQDEMCGHGFRATARTILDEILHYRPDIIEHQLGHQVKDPNGTAYNRTMFLAKRKEMMQDWADYLDKLKSGQSIEHLVATT